MCTFFSSGVAKGCHLLKRDVGAVGDYALIIVPLAASGNEKNVHMV
jgi:hypothetical protein